VTPPPKRWPSGRPCGLPIEEGLETAMILAYGKTASLSAQNKQFMDHIIRNYPKYQEG